MNNQSVTYTAHGHASISIFGAAAKLIRNLTRHRQLIVQLFRRDFIMSYKKSFIGVGWILISPLISVVSWVFMNYTGILQPGDVGVSYAAFVLLSSSIWSLFMGFYGSGSSTLDAGAEFIQQVKYPHEVLLFKQVLVQTANFSVGFLLNIVVLVILGVVPTLYIFAFPLLILPLFFIGAGLGLFFSLVSVVATDISRFATLGLSLLFYFTPVVYAANIDNRFLNTINQINPMTYLIETIRSLIFFGQTEYWGQYLLISAVSVLFFLFVLRVFYVSESQVIEKML